MLAGSLQRCIACCTIPVSCSEMSGLEDAASILFETHQADSLHSSCQLAHSCL